MLYQPLRRSLWRRHPLLTTLALIAVGWLLIAGWYTTVAVAALIVVAVTVRRRTRAMKIRDAGLRARADYEHRLCLTGDPRGTFGRYPPVWSVYSDVRAVVPAIAPVFDRR